MVHIRQHGDNNCLHDIASFIPILENSLSIREWEISVEWCSGEGAAEIECTAKEPMRVSHQKFCDLYKGIYQTIDGLFIIYGLEGSVSLLAVDSSFWEVESDILGLEEEFEDVFGLYTGQNIQQK